MLRVLGGAFPNILVDAMAQVVQQPDAEGLDVCRIPANRPASIPDQFCTPLAAMKLLIMDPHIASDS